MSVAYSSKVLSFPRDHFCHLFYIQDNPVTVCEMTKALKMPETDPRKNAIVFDKTKFNREERVNKKQQKNVLLVQIKKISLLF